MDVNQWTAAIHEWAEAQQGETEQHVRRASLQILGRIIERSPVGNPKLWKINRLFAEARHNAKVVNAANRAANGGRLKRGTKVHAAVDVQFLADKARGVGRNVQFQQKGWAAKSYVGGRFRGNWQVTFDTPAAGALDIKDKTGEATLARGQAVLQGFDGSQKMIWFTNNVPYALRLEYGYSTQVPEGIVRVVFAEMAAKGVF